MISIPLTPKEIGEVGLFSARVETEEYNCSRSSECDYLENLEKRMTGYLAEYAVWKLFFNGYPDFKSKINQGTKTPDIGFIDVKSTSCEYFSLKRSLCSEYMDRVLIVCKVNNIRNGRETSCDILGSTTLGFLVKNSGNSDIAEVLFDDKTPAYKCNIKILNSLSTDPLDFIAFMNYQSLFRSSIIYSESKKVKKISPRIRNQST